MTSLLVSEPLLFDKYDMICFRDHQEEGPKPNDSSSVVETSVYILSDTHLLFVKTRGPETKRLGIGR